MSTSDLPPDPTRLVDLPAPPGSWEPARRAALRMVSPIQRILAIETASALFLFAATLIALLWANSSYADSYTSLWHTSLGVTLDRWSFHRPLHFWVNDGLMTIFFLVVGLEIRREIHEGALSDLRRAILPLAAALGGMLVPAAIYAAFNHGSAGARGWGIPMATDIAFAVGALALLGSRVPAGLRILLLALAVIDDIGAILVIAIFYTDGVVLSSLGLAALGVAGVKVLQWIGVSRAVPYIAPGVLVWAGLYDAGVHPSLTGVILGLLTPVLPWNGTSSSERVQHVLHPWVAFGIMPLFALANAGVALGGAELHGDGMLVFLGVAVGLAVGKPIGIFAACAAATTTGVAARSSDSTHLGVLLVGMTGGIGFTMSLFVAQLAFPPGPMLDTAKLAILVGSATAMVIGLLFGRVTLRTQSTQEQT